ncbi:phosphotransferase family protein [Paractinoplanes maris]|uniref:phosphotransferase family protein n=1 Tax=Paractinoplanes maris TaxID=1734446 RepID=UPI00202197E7|nr:phosphotransferase [Actinoplanes maris]
MVDAPPPAALAWVADVTGAPITAVRRLAGGTHAATHLIESGGVTEVVLRRFPPGDSASARKARILGLLDGLDGLAPRLIAADPAGARFGEPSVVISRLPGQAEILLAQPEALGRILARVHAAPFAGTAAGDVLTHFDYWSGNVLYEEGQLTGVVDWSAARSAPRGFDVSWCRLDLVLLHGPGVADDFLDAYQDAAGLVVPDRPEWDRRALDKSADTVETWIDNYHDLGRLDLTPADLRERHTAGRSVLA